MFFAVGAPLQTLLRELMLPLRFPSQLGGVSPRYPVPPVSRFLMHLMPQLLMH